MIPASIGLALAVVATSTVPSEAPIRLAAPGLQLVKVDPTLGEFFGEHFAQKLVEQGGIRVTTRKEVAALIGLERQKQLMGCKSAEDESSCLAELAGALGVDGLVTGTLARVGSDLVANIKIVASSNGRTLTAISVRGTSDEQLLGALSAAAPGVADDLRVALNRRFSAPITARSAAWIPAVAGGLAVLSGGALFGIAKARQSGLEAGRPLHATIDDVRAEIAEVQSLERLGVGAFVAGGVGLAVAGAMYTLGAPSTSRFALRVGADGAIVLFQGALE